MMNNRLSSIRCLSVIVLLLFVPMSGCGKKGDPTLRSYEKPDTPSSLSAVHREDAILLKWGYPKSKENLISEFLVFRSSGVIFENIAKVSNDKRNFDDKDVRSGIAYKYKIISKSLKGTVSNDTPELAVTPTEVPPRPQKPEFSVSGNTVTIKWESKDPASLFNIYRSAEKGVYGLVPINILPVTGNSFRDGLSLSKAMHYTVRGLRGSTLRDEGPASEEITVDASEFVPAKPEQLQAYAAPDRVILSWKEMDEPWITGFRIYRISSSGEQIMIGQTQVPAFTDNDSPTSKRDYRVSAIGIVKEGPASEIRGVIHIPQR